MAADAPAALRSDRIADELAERELDLLLVNHPYNLRYLTGFTGSSGLALLGAGEGGMRRFFTDFRYETQSAEQLPDGFERHIVAGELLNAVAGAVGAGGRLGFDDAWLSVKHHAALREKLPAAWELVPSAGLVERFREVKDDGELALIRRAAELVDGILAWIAERGLAGRTERDVAVELEYEMRRRGADEPSFPSIVASGAHGALPHAQPRDVEIPRGVLVTIDLGARVDGYCSDCTRTFATGELEPEAREIYELVLAAERTGVAAVMAGRSGKEVDAIARAVIEEAGYGERFGHGLGHGVGLDVHESPRLSRTASDEPLRAGDVVTVEPGVYLPERLGVRIEDLVVVGEDGVEILSHYPTELVTVG